MQTSGFLTRSVASFAISRNFCARSSPYEALGFAPLETEELLPVAALLVHLPEVVDRAPVLRIDRDDRLVRLHGLGLVRELARVELGGLRVERRPSRPAFGDDRGELEQRLDVLVVALGRFLLVGERAKLGDLARRPPRRLAARARRAAAWAARRAAARRVAGRRGTAVARTRRHRRLGGARSEPPAGASGTSCPATGGGGAGVALAAARRTHAVRRSAPRTRAGSGARARSG